MTVINPGGFHLIWQQLRRVIQLHQLNFPLSLYGVMSKLNIADNLPTAKPSIDRYNFLMDLLRIYVEGMGLSALKHFIIDVKRKDITTLRKSTLRDLCYEFATKFMCPFSDLRILMTVKN